MVMSITYAQINKTPQDQGKASARKMTRRRSSKVETIATLVGLVGFEALYEGPQ